MLMQSSKIVALWVIEFFQLKMSQSMINKNVYAVY